LVLSPADMRSLSLVVVTCFRPSVPVAATVQAEDNARLEAVMAERVNAAVTKAVAEIEQRQARQTAELLAAADRRYEQQRQIDMQNVAETISVMQKRYNVHELLASNLDLGGSK